MPQRPTTHKDLHRAAIGSVFTLVCLLVKAGAEAQNSQSAASAGLSTKAQSVRLVKNERARPTAAGPSKVAAPGKVVEPAKAATPVTKGGKLREIPLSTLEAGKAVSTQSGNMPEGKPARKIDSASEKKTESALQKKTETTKTKITVERTTKTVTVPKLKNGLIPPPPPIMPIGMDVLGMYAQPVDYLSMKDLEARKKELMVRLNELDSTVADGVRQIRERKERAELFESLYLEGVVSRKELETAKREAGETNRDLKFKQDELESVKISMKAVNNRLAVLKRMESKTIDGKHKDKKAAATKLKSTEEKK